MVNSNRQEFHEKLKELIGNDNVYFSPPESKKLEYPCIIYKLSDVNSVHANNLSYRHMKRYQILHIYRNPDEDMIKDFLGAFSYCRFSRHYTSDNLNHDIFEIYYKN